MGLRRRLQPPGTGTAHVTLRQLNEQDAVLLVKPVLQAARKFRTALPSLPL